jgi:hypothetical protein
MSRLGTAGLKMRRAWNHKELRQLQSFENAKSAANAFNCSVRAVYNARQRNGIRQKPNVCAEDVAQMMMLKESGWSWPDIAKVKGITANHARVVATRAKKHGFDKYPKRAKL